jgi:hypothetical protein
VKHLHRLIDDLLDVSRVTRGKVQLKREPIEMAEVRSPMIPSTIASTRPLMFLPSRAESIPRLSSTAFEFPIDVVGRAPMFQRVER